MSEQTFEGFIDEKINADADFQATLTDLSEDDKATSIEAKRLELLKEEAPKFFDNASKHEKAYNDTKTRAEKAEAELKKVKPPVEKKNDESGLSTKDFYALTDAKVPEEDVDDVLEFAKFKGISVKEALASSVIKTTLAEKAETRRTANATQTRTARSQQAGPNGDDIIAEVKAGKGDSALPEAGSKEAEALFWARRPGAKRP